MSEKQTSMAGQKNTKSRNTTREGVGGTTININTPTVGEHGQPESKVKQQQGAELHNEDTKPEDPPKPPIYETPQIYRLNSNGEAVLASPLASTLFARFDRNYTGIQPAEFAVFRDLRFEHIGHI